MQIERSNATIGLCGLAQLLRDRVTSLVLTNVKLTGNEDAMRMLWAVLRGHPSLTALICTNVTFEDPDVNADLLISVLFASCRKLVRVVLNNVKVSVSAIMCIEYSPNLSEVCFLNNHYTDTEAVEIAKVLVANKRIEKVEFSGNGLTEQGSKAFQVCLSLNKSIQVVTNQVGESPAQNNNVLQRQSAIAA